MGYRVTWHPHRDRAALARIAQARYAAPDYAAAVALLRIDGGEAFSMVSAHAVSDACREVAEREDRLAALAGEGR